MRKRLVLRRGFFACLFVICLGTRLFAADAEPGLTLPEAAEQGDLTTVRSLLQKSDVNLARGDGMTALHWAAYQDNLEMARVLLQAGANVNAANRLKALTPLLIAAQAGDAAMLDLLLKSGANANLPNALGTTPLMLAAASGKPDAVKTLLDHGADVNARESARRQTALMFAAALNRDAVVRLLASRGADLNATSKIVPINADIVDEDGNSIPAPSRTGATKKRGQAEGKVAGMGGMSALHYAAREGLMAAVQALVESGADVNKTNPVDKSTPLVIAISNGHYDVAKYLVDRGADPNLQTIDGLAALYATVESSWAPVAWTPTASTSASGITQQQTSYLELMKLLLDHGANPNARISHTLWFDPPHHNDSWAKAAGTTPFWRAAQATDLDAMKVLVAHGADPKVVSAENDTPLSVAAGVGWNGNFSTNAPNSFMASVKYLVEDIHLDVNVADTSGYTAVMGAAYRGDNEMIEYLNARGARLDVKTKRGWSVTDMANGPYLRSSFPLAHPETVALLQKLGAPALIKVQDEEILGVIGKREKNLATTHRSDNARRIDTGNQLTATTRVTTIVTTAATHVSNLACSLCGREYEAGKPHNLCTCGGPLLVRYDLERIRRSWRREDLASAPNSMWRYSPVLPVLSSESIVSLGEGMTPLLPARRTGRRIGAADLWVKDEGLNPTGSFKARGMSCAVSMCVELGLTKLAAPSAGNAASALAAYAAAAGLEAHIFMPKDVPQANYVECRAYGARVTLVDGLISDCGRIVAERAPTEGWFDLSTLKEPYRIEGKKTMGYEVAEQFGWKLPDVIFYPTGGGVGMIGMWKAFSEMEAFGWIGPERPKMIAVQAEGCQPITRAFEEGAERSRFLEGAETVASGLRVPKPLGDFLVLDAVRKSGGTAISISDPDLMDAGAKLASDEGIFACPEGAACVAAAERLLRSGFLKSDDRMVIYNTGSGLKYLEAYSERFPRP